MVLGRLSWRGLRRWEDTLSYEVQEVGMIPVGCIQTTQLMVPLNSHPFVLLHFLVIILVAFFPCFFQSFAVFGKLGRVLKVEDTS
jgi:hypothetical protein